MDELTPGDVPLLESIEALIGAGTWPRVRTVVRENPLLLSDRALFLLDLVAEQARADDDGQDDFSALREFMVRSTEIGVDEAYDEMAEVPVPPWLASFAERIETTDDVLSEVAEYDTILSAPRFRELPTSLQAQILGRAASALLRRRDAVPEFDDLDRAESLLSRSAEMVPDWSGLRDEIDQYLLYASVVRYESTCASSDLDAVIDVMRRQHIRRGDAPVRRADYLASLGAAMLHRHLDHGFSASLDLALDLLQESLHATSADDPERAKRLDDLSMASLSRFEIDSLVDHLETSIHSSQEAVALTPEAAVEFPLRLTNLGNALLTRFEVDGDARDLDDAISVFTSSTVSIQEDDEHYPSIVSNFSNGLWRRYELRGDIADLDRSIDSLQRVVESSTREALGGPLTNLGVAFRRRYEARGRLDDLNSAIDCLRAAVDQVDQRLPIASLAAGNLGTAVIRHYEVTEDPDDLDEGIRLYRRAVALASNTAPDLPTFLANLGSALVAGYEIRGRADEADEAVVSMERAVELTSETSPELARRLTGLSSGLALRYRLNGDFSDVDRAARLLQRAVDLTGSESPDLAVRLTNLGMGCVLLADHLSREGAQRLSHDRRQEVDDRRGAGLTEPGRIAQIFRGACERGLESSIATTTQASVQWGEWAERRRSWSESAEAYGFGLIAVVRLARLQLLRSQQETQLEMSAYFSSQSAFALAEAGEATSAALSLEQGRAVLLDQALQLVRADLGQLRDAGWSGLADRYQHAAAGVRDLQMTASSSPMDGQKLAMQPEHRP